MVLYMLRLQLLQIRNRKFAERLKERHVRASMLQQQLNQVQLDKEDRIKSILRLKRYMEELEKGILVSAVAFRGESGSEQESLPEGDILKFSPSELEQFLEERREVMNKLLLSLEEKGEQQTELEAKAAEATLQFVRELKEKSEGRLTVEEREDQVEVLEERVEDLTNQLEDSRHNEEKYQMKVGDGMLCLRPHALSYTCRYTQALCLQSTFVLHVQIHTHAYPG